jgi:hypothetical protein
MQGIERFQGASFETLSTKLSCFSTCIAIANLTACKTDPDDTVSAAFFRLLAHRADSVVNLGLDMLGSGHFASSTHKARVVLYLTLAGTLCGFDAGRSGGGDGSGGANAAYTAPGFPQLLSAMTEPPPPSAGSSRLALPAQLITSLAGFCTSSSQLLQSGKSGAGGQTATTAFAFLQTLVAILNRPESAASGAGAAARDAALNAARDIIQYVKARSYQLAAASSAQEIMLLFELSVACNTPFGDGAQQAAEEALVRLRGDAASNDLLNKVMR